MTGSMISCVSPRIWAWPGGRDANDFHRSSPDYYSNAFRLTSMLQNIYSSNYSTWNAFLTMLQDFVWPCKKCRRNSLTHNAQCSPTTARMNALTTPIVLECIKTNTNAVFRISSAFFDRLAFHGVSAFHDDFWATRTILELDLRRRYLHWAHEYNCISKWITFRNFWLELFLTKYLGICLKLTVNFH